MNPRRVTLLVTLLVLALSGSAFGQSMSCPAGTKPILVYPEAHAMAGRTTWLVAYNATGQYQTVRFRSPQFVFRSNWIAMGLTPLERQTNEVASYVWDSGGFVLEVDAPANVVIAVTSWDTSSGAYLSPFTVPATTICR